MTSDTSPSTPAAKPDAELMHAITAAVNFGSEYEYFDAHAFLHRLRQGGYDIAATLAAPKWDAGGVGDVHLDDADMRKVHDYSIVLEKIAPELAAVLKRIYPVLYRVWCCTPAPARPAEGQVERVARAICEADNHAWPADDYNGRTQQRFYMKLARAALAALRGG